MAFDGGLQELNPAQREAALFGVPPAGPLVPGPPLLVIAGAGSGKTSTLAHRVAHLILRGADPDRIALLTFTRRAAEAMVRRAERICAATLGGEAPVAGRLRWAGTFHAIGARLLREHADAIGLDPGFTILDRGDAADLLDLVRDELRLAGGGERRFPQKGTCLAIYSYAVNAQAPLEAVLRGRRSPGAATGPASSSACSRPMSRPSSARGCSTTTTCCCGGSGCSARRSWPGPWATGSTTCWSTSTRTPTPSRPRSCAG